jgi:predicted Rdx family selenoprotein
VSLATEILSRWAPIFRTVRLESADHGRFEVTLDGELVFSKSSLGRHAKDGEIIDLFVARIGPSLNWRKSE